MPKAKLTLVSVSETVSADKTKQALAALYQKPESHFDLHCQHLFELKKPIVLLKKVDLNEAEKHLAKLNEIGINCEIKKLENSEELSLVPVDAKSASKPVCPACEQETDDPDVCDHCGVIMKKFAEQQKIDEQLQNKIASAERTDKRIQEARLKAAEQEKDKKEKSKKKPVAPEIPAEAPAEEDVFKVKVVEEKNNKVLYFAVAGALLATAGGGYLAHSLKQSQHAEGTDYNLASVEEPAAAIGVDANGKGDGERDTQEVVAEVTPMVESTEFSRWRTRMADIEKLKHQLDELNAEQYMSATMSGLITSMDDPMVKIIGEHYTTQLHMQKPDTGDQFYSHAEFEKRLKVSSAAMRSLSLSPDRLYAALSLAQTYQLLGNLEEAKNTYRLAESYALDTIDMGQGIDIVFAEVTIAEHQLSKGQMEKADAHFAAAMAAAETIEAGPSDNNTRAWAIAYIARREAQLGMYAKAYEHLESIPDERVKDIAMDDISMYADEIETDFELQSLDANEREFADDPELMLLFENTRKMKENAKKVSNLLDR